jgi:hypothetical protein
VSSLLRQLVQHRSILPHHAFRHFHLRREFRVVHAEAHTIRRFEREQLIAFLEPEAREQLLGQNHARRVADSGDLEFHLACERVMTSVMNAGPGCFSRLFS